ncbi:hypothetical protein AB0P23_10455 [Rhodococcus sp. NPDC077669]|uniref:hypothetical protein n=1 Tax=Rhodococcus sp. NPDC077669 TaxID=3155174 RepID=UPI003414F176
MTGLVCAASVVVYLALAVPTIASIALAAAIAVVLAVGSLRSMEWAWCVFFFALCSNGVQVTVAGLSIRPEYFATPLFLLALHAHVRRDPPASVGNSLGPGLVLGGAGLIAVALASSMVFALDPERACAWPSSCSSRSSRWFHSSRRLSTSGSSSVPAQRFSGSSAL